MVKIDIISGFLGAGKTTFIKKLIKEAFQGEKIVLIENEFGEIGVDSGFLQDAGIEIKEMNSGCICCSLVGDFEASLKEVITTYKPERIIIEPSGVGKLSDIEQAVQTICNNENNVKLNNKITVVNAQKASMYAKNFGEFFINQVEYADAVVLSRTTNIDEKKLNKAIELIEQYNNVATKMTTPWDKLDGKEILMNIENQHQLEESLLNEVNEHHHVHSECGCDSHQHVHSECGCGCGGHHEANDVFTSWGIETANKYTEDQIATFLQELEEEHMYGAILRAKGMLECSDNKWIYFDYVPGEAQTREGSICTIGKICVIGTQLNDSNLKKLFEKTEV
ncbi:GTP-binding protein [Tannockella kyphosi]|uniref:GTP-binding protein n=1 Tax=Tannockella kyphosi TaxID=2899121 RepID=UPI00201240F9|nr:GTP-binding protein [Tannockella kyphosi]